MRGQIYVGCEDMAPVAPTILRHRLIPNFAAQSEEIASDDIMRLILEQLPQGR